MAQPVIKAFGIAPETRDQLIDLLEAVAREGGSQAAAAANIVPNIKAAPAASISYPAVRTIYEAQGGPGSEA